MSNILVTGGAGFIGSHLVDALVEKGYEVRILDDFSTGKEENVEKFKDKVEIIRGDIREEKVVRIALENVEIVFHLAALPSVQRSLENPLRTHEVNATGTLLLLKESCELGVKKFIYASSSSVYGDSPNLPKSENMPPKPKSPYALSKLMGEQYLHIFYELYGLRAIALRYFNVFGPRQDWRSEYAAVIPRFIMALLEGESPVIYGDGTQTRDFTYVGNVVKANLLALNTSKLDGEVVNIACGKSTNLLELLSILQKILNVRVAPRFLPPRKGDVKHSRADISLAEKILDYKPEVSLEEGLRETVEWFEKNK